MRLDNTGSASRITKRLWLILPMSLLLALVVFWPSSGPLHAQGTQHGILLKWTPPATLPASYNIKRSLNTGNEITIATISGTLTQYQDNTATPGQTYFYTVTGFDQSYATPEGLPSNEVQVTFLLLGRPSSPSALTGVPN